MSALCEHGCQRGEPCKVIPCPALAPLRESRSMTRMKATTDPVGTAHRVIDCETERDALAARVEAYRSLLAHACCVEVEAVTDLGQAHDVAFSTQGNFERLAARVEELEAATREAAAALSDQRATNWERCNAAGLILRCILRGEDDTP